MAQDFAARKEPGVVRLFALGASTLVGFPNPPGADFPRILQLLLEEAYPERRFEVVNCGITAVNSHCILDFGREVLGYDADLLVVYMGHNEFAGPYGPTTPFVRFGNARWLIRAHMQVQRSKLYTVLKELVFDLSSLAREPAPFGLHLVTDEISWTEASYGRTVDNYRANLDELATAAARRGVPVLLGTLVSNVGGFYPLRSACDEADGEDGRLLAQEVDALRHLGRHGQARQRIGEALHRSPQCAAAHFEWGRALQRVGRDDAARAAYQQARDLDRLPFRAPTVLNDIVADAGRRHAGTRVADVEAAFRQASPGGIVGDGLMTDYLHPTERGHYLMARRLVEALDGTEVARGWGRARPQAMPSFEACLERLGYDGLAAALARNRLILFLRKLPYRWPPAALRERVATLIEVQLEAYGRLPAADRRRFRETGGLSFLQQAVIFAPADRRLPLQEALRRAGT